MRGHRAHLWAYIGDGGTVVGECVDCAFLWHQPHGEPPASEMTDIFFSLSSIRDRSRGVPRALRLGALRLAHAS